MRTTTRIAAAAAIALLAVAGCSDDGADPAGDPPAESTAAPDGELPEAPEIPEPDLEGLPEVIAEVNGTEILLADFTAAYEARFQEQAVQAQLSGVPLDQDALKTGTAELLVDTELLVQEADARDLTASEQDVQDTLTELAAAYGMATPDEVLAAFEEQGMAADEVREQLSAQVQLDLLYADAGGEFTPGQEELQQLYDDALAQQPPAAEGQEEVEPPAFDEVRPQLEQQLIQQHRAGAIEELLVELRESGDITVHI